VRKLLLISYHYPPGAAVGALRWRKFLKYLPESGWSAEVVTVRERFLPNQDSSTVADVRTVPVWRTEVLPNPRSAALAARSILWRLTGRGSLATDRDARERGRSFESRQHPDSGRGAGLRRILLSLCWTPDEHLGWLPFGLWRGLAVCRRERFDAIVSSGPPHTAHLIALCLRRATGIRWIADFRDPWTENPATPSIIRSALSDRLNAFMERAVVRTADRVMATTDRLRNEFVRRYAAEPGEKFVTLWNGFDPDDFSTIPRPVRGDQFTVAHVGSLYFRRSPVWFLTAVAELIGEGHIPARELRVVFVGDLGGDHRPAALARALGLGSIVREVPVVGHAEAIQWMMRSDLLLLLAQDQPTQVPAKVFEYLASGRPILAVTGEGTSADLVRCAGGSVSRDDVAEIKDAIHRSYLRHVGAVDGGDEPWKRGEIRLYDRRRLAADLARLLEALAASGRALERSDVAPITEVHP
jgi:glycosyltransferase involved in cell wall biosynthesis